MANCLRAIVGSIRAHSIARRRGFAIGAAVLAPVLAFVLLVNPGPLVGGAPLPPGGISRDRAVELAVSHVGGDSPQLEGTEAGAFQSVYRGNRPDYTVKSDRVVWAVTFQTTIVVCPPARFAASANPTCWSAQTAAAVVYLDYYTGDFLESTTSA
jgi:hypothetical protein